jgi:hypothetical protein
MQIVSKFLKRPIFSSFSSRLNAKQTCEVVNISREVKNAITNKPNFPNSVIYYVRGDRWLYMVHMNTICKELRNIIARNTGS